MSATVKVYGPGELPDGLNPGDFGLTLGETDMGQKIRELQEAAGYPPEYAAWGHSFNCMQEDGLISEALEWGVEAEWIGKYRDRTFAIVDVGEPDVVRQKGVAFWWEVLEARPRYSYETIALMWAQIRLSQAAHKLGRANPRKPGDGFDFAVTFQRTNTSICSGCTAEGLKAMGRTFPKGTGYVVPARLGQMHRAAYILK